MPRVHREAAPAIPAVPAIIAPADAAKLTPDQARQKLPEVAAQVKAIQDKLIPDATAALHEATNQVPGSQLQVDQAQQKLLAAQQLLEKAQSTLDQLTAQLQKAQGDIKTPKAINFLTPVKGHSVNFTVGDEKYSGTVSAAGLRLKSSSSQSQLLKRKPCSSYF